MAEVGVLSLQIHDNSEKAASGLDRLASALERVRSAVGGIRLGSVANQIEKINTSVRNASTGGTVENLNGIASALKRVKEAADGINLSGIRLSTGAGSAAHELENSIGRSVEAAQSAQNIASAFVNVRSAIEEDNRVLENMNSLVQNVGWSAGDAAEQFRQMFSAWNRVRMSFSLGGGSVAGYIGAGAPQETGWQQYNPWGEVKETGWTEWKEGAIEAEYTISDAMENTTARITDGNALIVRSLETAQEKAEETAEAFIGMKRVWNSDTGQFESQPYTQSEFDNRIDWANNMRTALAQVGEEEQSTSVQTIYLRDELDALTHGLSSSMSAAAGWAQGELAGLREGFQNLVGPVTHLIRQFGRLARMRIMRAILREIASGIKEGTENMYYYSRAIKSDFAESMDDAAASLLQMKNSIGAALAPAISAVIPILNAVVSAFITVINYANQFIALLRGQATWTRANKTATKAFDDTKKSAAGAAAAIKELLADWDELNIIQSETGGGSGVGGGTKAEDYLNMFEEVSEFENGVRRVVELIDKYMGGIKTLAAEIGAIILGWKISNAFDNLLGRLGSLVAGGLLIKIGLELSYGSGFNAGQKGAFDGLDIAGTVAGAIATAVGGYLILGTPGIWIGLGVSLLATLTGYIEGKKDAEDALKWGSTSLTPEEIQDHVRSLFKFDVYARISILGSVIENQESAKRELNEKIAAFSESLEKVRIKVDGTPQGINEASESARAVIEQINKNLKESEENLEVLAKITLGEGEDSEDGTDSLLGSVKIANKTMTDYFTGLGKDIAHWIDEGEKTGWKNNEAEMALELMQHQQNIFDQANQKKIARDFQVESEFNLSGLTRENAQELLNEEMLRIQEYRDKLTTAYENEAKNYYYYADLADAAGLVSEDGSPLSKVYIDAAEKLLEDVKNGKIDREIQPAIDAVKKEFAEALKKVYGSDFSEWAESATLELTYGIGDWTFASAGSLFGTIIKDAFDTGGVESAAAAARNDLQRTLEGIDTSGTIRSMMDTLGLDLIDVIGDDALKTYARGIVEQVTNGDTETASAILAAMGLSKEAIEKALASETIDVPQSVLDSMWDADWQNMADAELAELISTLRETFGSDAVEQALGELDIPEADLVAPVEMDVPVSVQPEIEEATSEASTTEEVLGGLSAEAESNLNATDSVITDHTFPSTNTVDTSATTDSTGAMAAQVHSHVMSVASDLNYLNSMVGGYGYNGIGGAGRFSNVTGVTVHSRATGGNIRSGELFFGNENGRIEMMGKMGNSAVVANNQQIVEGISKGVAASNSGMESAMNMMVALMRQFVSKEFTARVVPSSGMGRNNVMSGDAYRKVTG